MCYQPHLPRQAHTHTHTHTHTNMYRGAHTYSHFSHRIDTHTHTHANSHTIFFHTEYRCLLTFPHILSLTHIYARTSSPKLTPPCTRRPANMQVLQKKSADPTAGGKERWELLISRLAFFFFLSLSKFKKSTFPCPLPVSKCSKDHAQTRMPTKLLHASVAELITLISRVPL